MPHAERVALLPATPDTALPLVQQGYTELPQDIAAATHVATREELAACGEQDTLWIATVDGDEVGVIALERHAEFGLSGWCVVEEVLLPAYRGLGLAPAMQRAAVEELAREEPAWVLMGTIDRCNRPSRATAVRVGRREVAAYWFLNF